MKVKLVVSLNGLIGFENEVNKQCAILLANKYQIIDIKFQVPPFDTTPSPIAMIIYK